MTPKEKFKELIEKSGLSYPKYAQKIGAKLDDIKNYMSGKSKKMPADLARALEIHTQIPYKWWRTGEGEMFISGQKEPSNEEALEFRQSVADYFHISPEKADEIGEFLLTEQGKMLLDLFFKSVLEKDKEATAEFLGAIKYRMLDDKK